MNRKGYTYNDNDTLRAWMDTLWRIRVHGDVKRLTGITGWVPVLKGGISPFLAPHSNRTGSATAPSAPPPLAPTPLILV